MRSGDDAEHFVFYEDEFLWGVAVEVTFDRIAIQGEGAHIVFGGAGGDLEAVADFAVYLDYDRYHFVEY